MVFQPKSRRLLLSGVILVMLLLLAGCNSTSTGNATATHSPASTPRLVTPASTDGSPGHGPIVVVTSSPVPGGPAGSQKVVLGDRTLSIYSVTKQVSTNPHVAFINLDLAIQNTGNKTIKNQPAFFQLLGSEGDVFTYQYNSSDNFYGSIGAHATNRGHIVFQLPVAAASKLSLLYHPEIATETAIIELKIA
ncbi:MAG TPA: DUF4352 domain-containing protein [Ktedonobacteraceae bacterium]